MTTNVTNEKLDTNTKHESIDEKSEQRMHEELLMAGGMTSRAARRKLKNKKVKYKKKKNG
jgi:hypothetical protein